MVKVPTLSHLRGSRLDTWSCQLVKAFGGICGHFKIVYDRWYKNRQKSANLVGYISDKIFVVSVGYVTERVRSFCSIGHLNDRLRQKAPRRCFTFRLLHDQNRRVEKKVFYLKLCFPYSDGVLFDKTFIKVNKLRGRAGNERIYFASFGYFALVTSNIK